jgi:hypothetical protein
MMILGITSIFSGQTFQEIAEIQNTLTGGE